MREDIDPVHWAGRSSQASGTAFGSNPEGEAR
jgi:hypothetical protein